jgi:hypothetical protein
MMNEYGNSHSTIVPGNSPNKVCKEKAEVMEGSRSGLEVMTGRTTKPVLSVGPYFDHL